jgi:hypothetical protein
VPDVPTSLPEDCRGAVLACFSRDVAQRPKAHQLRRFPWFSGTKAPAATVPVVHGHESSGPAATVSVVQWHDNFPFQEKVPVSIGW